VHVTELRENSPSGKPESESTEAALSKVAGSVYGLAIEDQLSRERDRKASIEGRALQVVSISTLSAALLTSLVANALPKTSSTVGAAAVSPLIDGALVTFQWALTALVVAVAFGLAANWRGNSRSSFANVDEESMEQWLNNWGETDVVAAGLAVAKVRLSRLRDARAKNRQKKWLFTAAVSAQCVALGFVAWTFWIAPGAAAAAALL